MLREITHRQNVYSLNYIYPINISGDPHAFSIDINMHGAEIFCGDSDLIHLSSFGCGMYVLSSTFRKSNYPPKSFEALLASDRGVR